MTQPPIWSYRLTHRDGVLTLVLSGELDLACASAVLELMLGQAESPEVDQAQVDLAEVGFIDSSVLGALVTGRNQARERGRGFAVVNPSPPARRVLDLTGLADVLISS